MMFRYVFLCLLLSGCAADLPASAPQPHQAVAIITPGQTGANCFIQVGGKHFTVSPPATIQLDRNTAPMDVTCFKGEHMVARQKIVPTYIARDKDSGDDCETCRYPATVNMFFGLNPRSFDVNLTEIK